MRSCSPAHKGVRTFFFSLFALAFTSAAVAAPNAPTYLAARAETSTSVVLLWNDNSADETGFEIQYNTGGGWISFGTVPANQTGVGLSTPAAFSAQYQVRAFNGSGNSAFTPIVTCTQASFNAPGSLNGLVTGESVLITWADNATTETGCEIETRQLPSGSFSLLGAVGANIVVVDLTGSLVPGVSHEVRVRTRSGASAPYTYTGYSSPVTVSPQFIAPTAFAATVQSETAVAFSWADNSSVEGGYEVQYSPAGANTYTSLVVVGANTTSTTVSNLTPGQSYDFRVRAAYGSNGSGGFLSASAFSSVLTRTMKDGFTSGTAPPIFYNQAFSYQAVVSTGSSRSSWSITGLPAGLTFNSSTGAITGTPTVTGAFNCPMSATFANGWTANNTLQLRVIRAPGAPVSATAIGTQTLTAGGNTSVALTDKFSDPDSESAVRIVTNVGTMDFILYNSATPQAVTNFLSYVNAAVNNYNGAVFHRSVSGFVAQGGAFKVQSAPNNFSVTPTSASPTNEPGISNLRGTVAMAKIGGNPNSATNQFFVNLGNNSSNLDRDSGSPNANGGFTAFARVAGNGITVADAIGNLPTATYSVNLGGTPTSMDSWPLTSASAAMDTTKVVSITSAAPVAVLSYSVTGNTNSAVASATISGTNVQINALAGGQTSVTVTATDLDGSTVSQNFTVTVNQTPAFTNGPPPNTAVVGTAYNFAYTTTGFPAPTFSTSGTLPPGLSLSTAGVLSGTPTTPGTYSGIVVTASNGIGVAPTQTISITVNQVPVITSAAPPSAGVLGTAYNHSYAATGSPVPTYSMTGTLPPGLSLSTAGVISGTPTAVGTFMGTVTATNVAGTSPQAFSITINQVPAFTNGPPPGTGVFGTAYTTFTYTASGSPAPTFNVTSGALPTGLSLSTSGVITGTPTAAGTFTGTVTASNGIGTAATQDFSIVVAKAAATVSLGSLAQTYDGSAKPASATTTPAALTVNFTYDGSSTAPTNAGTYAVIGTISDANYTGSASGTLALAKAAATVTLGSLAQTYDGSPKPASATTAPANLGVNFTYDGSATAPTNAGSYAAVGTISDTNYAGSSAGTLVIAKATAALALNGLLQTYDGSPKPVSATTTPSGLTVGITYDGSAIAPTNHGSYVIAASINQANYIGTAAGTLTITGQSASGWRTQHFTTEQITAGLPADDADPDGDGLKNLIEYALGMDPLSRTPALLPTRDANGLTLIFTRPKDLPDVTYGAESTDNLGTWNSVTLEVITDGPVQTLRARDPLTTGNPARRFMRLVFETSVVSQ